MNDTITSPKQDVQRMKRKEAMECTRHARACLREAWTVLLNIHEREGWRAMGYCSWAEYCAVEFAVSRAHAYRLLVAAQLAREVSNWTLPPDLQPKLEAQFRELARVNCEQMRREIWDEARADGDTSAAGIRTVIAARSAKQEDRESADDWDEQEYVKEDRGGQPRPAEDFSDRTWQVAGNGRLKPLRQMPEGKAVFVYVRPGDLIRFTMG